MKTELKYGIIGGIGICLWVLTEYFLGFHNERIAIGKYTGYFASLIPIIVLYLGIKSMRDHELKGSITFLQGLKAGLIISFIAAIITTVYFWIYNQYINPGWMDAAMLWEKQEMVAKGISQVVMDKKMAELNNMNSDFAQLTNGFALTMGAGMVISAVVSLILKRSAPLVVSESKAKAVVATSDK